MGDIQQKPASIPAPPGVAADVHAASLHVVQLHDAVRESKSSLLQRRLELGRALWELKPRVPHGLWKDHLATYGIHYHTASLAMRLVKRVDHSAVPKQGVTLRQVPHNVAGISQHNGTNTPSSRTRPSSEKETIVHFSESGRFDGKSLNQVEVELGIRPRPLEAAGATDAGGLEQMTVEELEVYEASLPARARRRDVRGQMQFADMYAQAKARVIDAIDSLCTNLPSSMGARMRALKENFFLAAEAILGGAQ